MMTSDGLYLVLASVFVVYLLAGTELTARGMLKGLVALQVAGELIFHSRWETFETYAFLRFVSPQAELTGTALLIVAFLLLDSGSYAVSQILPAPPRPSGPAPAPSRSLLSLLLLGGLLKLVEFYSTGILTGATALSSYVPEDTVGLSFLLVLSEFFIPFALASWGRGRKNLPFPGLDLALLLALAYLSFSKAAILIYLFVYGPTHVLAHGWAETKRRFLRWYVTPILLGLGILMILTFALKTQNRANKEFDETAIVEAASGGVGQRFGSIYRTYLTVADEMVNRKVAPMGGFYHEQIAYLWVPRLLWPAKPRVASERLYYYLGVTEESYGTAFAPNFFGAMLVDFAVPGAFFAAFGLGMFLGLGDRWVRRLRRSGQAPSTGRLFFAAAWLGTAQQLSEGGVPPAVTRLLILMVAFAMVSLAQRAVGSGRSRWEARRSVLSVASPQVGNSQ
jgi:hypothetical protein